MGMIAASGGISAFPDRERRGSLSGRQLRSSEPRDLLSGEPAGRALARAQAYLAIGGGLVGLAATLLPHPEQFNVAGLLAVQLESIAAGLFLFRFADKVPLWMLRPGPLLGVLNTTLAVILSGYSTSGFAMFYLWVGLYAFYFMESRRQAILYVACAALSYGVAIAVTPATVANPEHAALNNYVVALGTLLTSSILLTYLRGRVERLMGRLTDAARTDGLTGLPNQVGLHEAIKAEIERADPEQRVVTVMVLDLDRFKDFNERHGVEAGDRLLKSTGDVIEGSTRSVDTVTRSGGSEFTIVLPETDLHRSFIDAEHLLAALRTSSGAGAELTASIGIAAFPEHGKTLEEILKAAAEAKHAAKALGGGRPVIYSREVTRTLGLASGRRSVESQAHVATVISLAEALDQRDPYTLRHSQTVARLCEMMARELNFDQHRIRRIRLAGILHDIGKIGVPDSILRKPGPLTDEEQTEMRRHPEIGARILSSSELEDIRSWIIAHHERPDGTGYPYGLTAKDIPLEASIVAIADAYEAMTSDRVYRLALQPEEVRRELHGTRGRDSTPTSSRRCSGDREGAAARR